MDLNNASLIKVKEDEKDELGKHFRDYLVELDSDADVKTLHIDTFLKAIFKNQNRQLY